MPKAGESKQAQPAAMEAVAKKSRSGPSGWAKYNKKRKVDGRVDAYVKKGIRAAVIFSTDRSPASASKPTTKSIATQTDPIKADSTQKLCRDSCVGEHVSGEPILWRGIFDMP